MDVRIFRVITFEDIEIPGRDPAAQAAVSKTELPVGIAAERRDALVAPPAGDKEILAVTGEADRAADTSVVSCGGLHESRIGCGVTDSRDLLHNNVPVTFRIKTISEDRVGHFCEHEEHSRMLVAEGQMPRAGAVRQADAAGCFPELSGFAVQLVDIDCVQAEVADQDFIPVFVENGIVSVRPFLAVRRVITNAAVLAEVAERTDRAVRIQVIEGDRSAAVTQGRLFRTT